MSCVDNSPPVIAMCGRGCIVFVAVNPELPPLVDASATPRVMVISSNSFTRCASPSPSCVVAAYAGLGPDARVLVRAMQQRALHHCAEMDSFMSSGQVASSLAEAMQEATQDGGMRPWGTALLIASIEPRKGASENNIPIKDALGFENCRTSEQEDKARWKPCLYQVDPSGWHAPVWASAIGAGAATLQADLARRWMPNLDRHELEQLGIDLLRSRWSREYGESDEAKSDEKVNVDTRDEINWAKFPSELNWRSSGKFSVAVLSTHSKLPELTSKIVSLQSRGR